MNAGREMTKTLIFVVTAVLTLAIAFFSRPSKESAVVDDEVGKVMFPALKKPNMVNGLEVLSFDEDLGQMSRFKVAQQDQGLFVIPSHQNYPADAQDRLVNAATMFVNLEVIRVVPATEADFETFGVIEPSPTETRVGDEGIGLLVTVFGKGEQGQTTLADLIIGKPVKGLAGQHYVRRPGKSRVYQVEIDPTQLSTRFQDWIETDLLKLNRFDVGALTLKDYSVETEGFNITGYDQRLELRASVAGDGWVLDDVKEGINGELQAGQLEEGETLNQTRLNVLRNALGELKIVDVQRKPRGLGADLKTSGEFLGDPESTRSLAERGFYAIKFQDGASKFLSSDGELLIDTKSGVRYTLRFGRIAGVGEATKSDAGASETSLNRFMFVSVSLNEGLFPEPELEELPEADENDNEVALEIEKIQQANQRKIDARNDAVEKAKRQVEDLQYRFADWYYIVAEDVFKKLRLRRNDLFTFSEDALKSGSGIQAFRELQRQGLK